MLKGLDCFFRFFRLRAFCIYRTDTLRLLLMSVLSPLLHSCLSCPLVRPTNSILHNRLRRFLPTSLYLPSQYCTQVSPAICNVSITSTMLRFSHDAIKRLMHISDSPNARQENNTESCSLQRHISLVSLWSASKLA